MSDKEPPDYDAIEREEWRKVDERRNSSIPG